MGSRRGGRLGQTFRGTSERDDSGEATLEKAFDATATAAVLNAITEDGGLPDDLRKAAEAVLARHADGDPETNALAQEKSTAAVKQTLATRSATTSPSTCTSRSRRARTTTNG